MPAFLISLALQLGVPAKFAKVFIICIAAALLVTAVVGWFAWHDHTVITNHDARQDAATTRADRAADTHAAAARRVDDARTVTEAAQLQKVETNAPQNDLARRLARMRCIKLQQSARASGSVAPTC